MRPRADVKGSRRPCATAGCAHRSQTDGDLCWRCREGRTGHLFAEEPLPEAITEPCKALCCDRPARALGYCDTHYRQVRTHGRIGRIQQYHRAIVGRAA